ncbi:hypothetical protein HOH87_07730, partial [bacterium]|nr:hypothetical protein [bacterium]
MIHYKVVAAVSEDVIFAVNARVEITGLIKGTQYNGLKGSVIEWMPDKQRYQVGLDSGKSLSVKPENVQTVSVPSFVTVSNVSSSSKRFAKDEVSPIGDINRRVQAEVSDGLPPVLVKETSVHSLEDFVGHKGLFADELISV